MTFRDVFETLDYRTDEEKNLFFECAIESGFDYVSEDTEIGCWQTVARIMSYYPLFDSGLNKRIKMYAESDMSGIHDRDRVEIMKELLELLADVNKSLINIEFGKDSYEFVMNFMQESRNSNPEDKSAYGFVYIGNELGTDMYKIGMTKNLENRENTLRVGNIRLKFIAYKRLEQYSQLESFLHEVFKHKNIEREWFQFTKDELDELVKDYGFTYAVDGATEWQ